MKIECTVEELKKIITPAVTNVMNINGEEVANKLKSRAQSIRDEIASLEKLKENLE